MKDWFDKNKKNVLIFLALFTVLSVFLIFNIYNNTNKNADIKDNVLVQEEKEKQVKTDLKEDSVEKQEKIEREEKKEKNKEEEEKENDKKNSEEKEKEEKKENKSKEERKEKEESKDKEDKEDKEIKEKEDKEKIEKEDKEKREREQKEKREKEEKEKREKEEKEKKEKEEKRLAEQRRKKYVTISLEADVLGSRYRYLIYPQRVEIRENQRASEVVDRFLRQNGYYPSISGSIQSGYYLARVNRGGLINRSSIHIPGRVQKILKARKLVTRLNRTRSGSLGEFDITKESGWMYSVNGVYPNVGFSQKYLKNGDVVRIRFTLALGNDI